LAVTASPTFADFELRFPAIFATSTGALTGVWANAAEIEIKDAKMAQMRIEFLRERFMAPSFVDLFCRGFAAGRAARLRFFREAMEKSNSAASRIESGSV
jgi:hypothetical protein